MKRTIDMLHGSLWDKILIFALPIALTSLLQQLFNSADVAVVGRFAGSEALAAVGANAAVINLFVNLFVGLSVGANVVISRHLGAGNDERVSRAAHTSVVIALLGGLMLAVIGLFFARSMLSLMRTPENILDQAVIYLKIYFAGMPFIMLYNFTSAILRSRGDTRRPLIVLALSGMINIVLNLFFVIACKMDVAGVAIATVLSNVFSSVVLLVLLMRETTSIRIRLRSLSVNGSALREIAKIGVPAGVQGIMFSISNVIIQTTMNDFGSNVVAASAAALNFEFYSYFLLNAFSQAATTFIGQNYGAGNLERCSRVMWVNLAEAIIGTTALSLIMVLFRYPLSHIFSSDPEVIRLCAQRMTVILLFEFLNCALEQFSAGMRGLGSSLTPAIISMVCICGIRLLWIFTVFPAHRSFIMLVVIYPVSWVFAVAAMVIAYTRLSKRVIRSGRSAN